MAARAGGGGRRGEPKKWGWILLDRETKRFEFDWMENEGGGR